MLANMANPAAAVLEDPPARLRLKRVARGRSPRPMTGAVDTEKLC
jgi:hypothetical protein